MEFYVNLHSKQLEMTATTAFFHFAKKIHNRRRIPENPRIVAVGDVRGHHYP